VVNETDGGLFVHGLGEGGLADVDAAIDECAAQGEADRDGGDGRRVADLPLVPEAVRFLDCYASVDAD
jgi:hypothetical protein